MTTEKLHKKLDKFRHAAIALEVELEKIGGFNSDYSEIDEATAETELHSDVVLARLRAEEYQFSLKVEHDKTQTAD
jgi:hypothetical protein